MCFVSWVPLLQVLYQVRYCLQVVLLLFLSLFLVLFLHFSSDITIWSFSRVVLFNPNKCFVCAKISPVLVKFQDFLKTSSRVTKSLKFSKIYNLFRIIICLFLFCLDSLENFSVNFVESSVFVIVTFETAVGEVCPDVESKCMHLNVLLSHLHLVKQDFLSICVVPCPLVRVRQDFICLLHCYEHLFSLLISCIFVWMILDSHLSVILRHNSQYRLDVGRRCLLVHLQNLVVTLLHINNYCSLTIPPDKLYNK